MCQSADCQLFAANGGDKENFDVNNNGGGPGGGGALLPSTNCHCMLNRRTRRRHPATVQTPGRLEVGEVILEPLVSNRLEGSIDDMQSHWNSHNLCKSNNSYFSNSYQPLKPYRFDVVEENLAGGGGQHGGGKENNHSTNNSNNSSNSHQQQQGGTGWKYTYMSSSTKMI
jgi:hypothetical protein